MDNDLRAERGRRKKQGSAVLILTLVFSLLLLIICVLLLTGYSLDGYRSAKEIENLKKKLGNSELSLGRDELGHEMVVGNSYDGLSAPAGEDAAQETAASGEKKTVLEKYREIYELNHDLIGWLTIEGTKIDYPVMQTVEDEEYYLHRGYAGRETKEGLPFLDSRCMISRPSTNFIIYGHNMKSGDMFAELLEYEKPAFLEKHRLIRFDTVYEEAYYEVVSVFRTRVAYVNEKTFKFYNFIEADSPEEFLDFTSQISELSAVNCGVSCHYGDRFITLSTCEYTNEDGRFVVIARKVEPEQ